MQPIEGVEHAVDPPTQTVLELQDTELDHLVRGEVGTGGLHVDDEADERRLVRRLRAVSQRLQPAQHTIVTCAFEHGGNVVEGMAHVADDPGLALQGAAAFCTAPEA